MRVFLCRIRYSATEARVAAPMEKKNDNIRDQLPTKPINTFFYEKEKFIIQKFLDILPRSKGLKANNLCQEILLI